MWALHPCPSDPFTIFVHGFCHVLSLPKPASALRWKAALILLLQKCLGMYRPPYSITNDWRKTTVKTSLPVLQLGHLSLVDGARATTLWSRLLSWEPKTNIWTEMAHDNEHSLPSLSASYVSDFNTNYLHFHKPLRRSTISILIVQTDIRLWAFSFPSSYFHVLSNLLPKSVLLSQAYRTRAPIFWSAGLTSDSKGILPAAMQHCCCIFERNSLLINKW